jgi:hypothetical protein
MAPLSLIFGLREASVKIASLAFASSNSENISCVAFLKHKNNRKQGTITVASCNIPKFSKNKIFIMHSWHIAFQDLFQSFESYSSKNIVSNALYPNF